jgi:DNA repair exonuclease SbcCD ATPase subunit
VRLEVEASPTVADLQAEIERLKGQFRSASQRAGERARELESVRAKLERELERNGRLQGIERRQKAVEAAGEAIEARTADVAAREAKVEAAGNELADLERVLGEREAALRRSERMWEKMLDEREAELEQRAARLDQREAMLREAEIAMPAPEPLALVEADEDDSEGSERQAFRQGIRSLEPRVRPRS